MGRLSGVIFGALMVLATIYAYNYFSKDGITALGKKTSA